jgi:hypothetical protein
MGTSEATCLQIMKFKRKNMAMRGLEVLVIKIFADRKYTKG